MYDSVAHTEHFACLEMSAYNILLLLFGFIVRFFFFFFFFFFLCIVCVCVCVCAYSFLMSTSVMTTWSVPMRRKCHKRRSTLTH